MICTWLMAAFRHLIGIYYLISHKFCCSNRRWDIKCNTNLLQIIFPVTWLPKHLFVIFVNVKYSSHVSQRSSTAYLVSTPVENWVCPLNAMTYQNGILTFPDIVPANCASFCDHSPSQFAVFTVFLWAQYYHLIVVKSFTMLSNQCTYLSCVFLSIG